MRIIYNPWAQGAHPSGRLPLGRTQSLRRLLLSNYMGVDPGVRPVLRISRESSYLCNPTQTTDQEPQPTAAYIEIYP